MSYVLVVRYQIAVLAVVAVSYQEGRPDFPLVEKGIVQATPRSGGARAAANRGGSKISKTLRREGSTATRPCEESSFDGKFDLVITWNTYRPQRADVQRASLLDAPREQDTLDRSFIENQREITYVLRGAEKYGLLEYVNQVFVVVHPRTLEKYGAPRDLDWHRSDLHLVPADTIGATGNGYLPKLASLHKIKNISTWFLVLQDDVFPTMQFSLQDIYDWEARRPRIRMGLDTYIQGWCDDGKASLNHGPWFVSRCRLAELDRKYQSRFASSRAHNENRWTTIDAQCLYDNFALRTFASEVPYDDPLHRNYCAICHTAGGCDTEKLRHPHTLFVNLQGPGVSDEFPSSTPINRTTAHDAHGKIQSWLHSTYPTPSKFETKVDKPTPWWTSSRTLGSGLDPRNRNIPLM